MIEKKVNLREEIAFFNAQRDKLLSEHKGKFAVIKGNTLLGFFDTIHEAYAQGVKEFGREPFLVKEVREEEPVEQIPALMHGLLNARL